MKTGPTDPKTIQGLIICDPLYRNQSEVATAHFKINVDLRKKLFFRGSGVLFGFK